MKKVYKLMFLILLFVFIFPLTAYADTGPKPSVVIEIKSLKDEDYYVTLLSENESTGPWSYGEAYQEYHGDKTAFDKFSQYEDQDGYYFLGHMQDCSETDRFEWNYYPPQRFKVLIYYPDRDQFQISENVYERYAFDSYYELQVEDIDSSSLMLHKSYNYTKEIVALLIRIIITLFIEMTIAYLMGYGRSKNLKVIFYTNVITQIILNLFLNLIHYHSGLYDFVFSYVWLELLVMMIEAVIYKKYTDVVHPKTGRKMHPIGYAVAANTASFVIGVWLAIVIPGVF